MRVALTLLALIIVTVPACGDSSKTTEHSVPSEEPVTLDGDALLAMPSNGDRSYAGASTFGQPPRLIEVGGQPARLILGLHDGGVVVGIVDAEGAAQVRSSEGEILWSGTFDLQGPRPPVLTGTRIAPLATPDTDHQALVDAVSVVSTDGWEATLVEPTTRYDHGVLGDSVEAAGIEVVDPAGRASLIAIEGDAVVEGLSPMWADLDGDGLDEIVVTVSTPGQGAGIVAFDREGSVLAAGPPIGRSFRWRHQIGSSVMGDRRALIVVRTPHIGGIVEWYELRDGALEIVATADGVTSHRLGSRNLDLALIADVDGDGVSEVALPSQDRTELVLFERSADGVSEERHPLPATLTTNLAALETPDGLWFAYGLSDGTVSVWAP